MKSEERQDLESELKKAFQQEMQDFANLKSQISKEGDENKKKELEKKSSQLETQLNEIKTQIDKISELNEENLQTLKERIQKISNTLSDSSKEQASLQNEIIHKSETPTTYELLKDSNTYKKLYDIINGNQETFKDVPGETVDKKLEYIFQKIRSSICLFLENKFNDKEKYNDIINNTIAPALERNLIELLRDQGNEANASMLKNMDKISRDSLKNLFNGVSNLSKTATGAYANFQSWMNALDYLAVNKGILYNAKKSKVMCNPVAFQSYLNNSIFKSSQFSPYMSISETDRNTLFQIDGGANFKFGMTEEEKKQILSEIGDVKIVNNARTTSLIVKMLDKPEQFLKSTKGLQNAANSLLDGANSINGISKTVFGVDILGEIQKPASERGFIFKVLDFVCKMIGITGGLEGIVKNWRYQRLDLTPEKDDNIHSVFAKYQELCKENKLENNNITITDENSCTTMLSDFALHDPFKENSSTRGDLLRDSMVKEMDISLISPTVIKECLGDGYLKAETIQEDGKDVTKTSVDVSKIGDKEKKTLAQTHINNMKIYYSNFTNLQDFYKSVKTVDDISLYMTASLYSNKDDVIEGVKAKVFLPENYGVPLNGSPSQSDSYNGTGRDNLESSVEDSDKNHVSEQYIYDQAKKYGITDDRQIAYVLATVRGECRFRNIKETNGENKSYGKADSKTGKCYYGRGFIQLTHKYNYQKYTDIIKSSGYTFKDNEGNTIETKDIDLVNNPDLILSSNEMASFILIDRMKNGGPDRKESKKISHYVNDSQCDYYNARQIINGMSSSPEKYQNYANTYLNKLQTPTQSLSQSSEVGETMNEKNILIGPKLSAKNKDSIGGLGNSIMAGFQGYPQKTNFPNMDGVVGKTTTTHPDRFKSKEDVHGYVTNNPSVKSFMIYFGTNTQNNTQTLKDIKQWSEWLESEGIQPVLCTCIGEDSYKRLTELNSKIKALGIEKNRPVFDFASLYNNKKISMGGTHPNSKGYSAMADCINYSLSQ